MATTDVWPFIAGSTNFTMKFDYDGSGNQIYIGWAQPGSVTSATVWRIMQQTFNGSGQPTDIKWPSASTAFNYVWDSRTTYAYS